jgi:hypothetical protein
MKFFILSLVLLLSGTAQAQSAKVAAGHPANLIKSTDKSPSAENELLQLQEAEVNKLNASLEQLRELYAEGLIAKVELEQAEANLKTAQAKVETTENQITSAAKLAEETKKAAALSKFKPLAKPTLLPISANNFAILRSGAGSWSIANLSTVQRFFQQTFGRALPMSAVGQSSTHDRLGWDHRNAVDVGLHPDSAEGHALINYLQQAGIPFLAFRSAIPGVATGPHIHIGFPSHRLV